MSTWFSCAHSVSIVKKASAVCSAVFSIMSAKDRGMLAKPRWTDVIDAQRETTRLHRNLSLLGVVESKTMSPFQSR